ncbi:hypothetical protein F5Y05DRAFT_374739 [Hypoxylon sp. FL0543]|nr:hypothetical protein F5Y05DRAFT_374739 [Hypoxylon sp. FL0543]
MQPTINVTSLIPSLTRTFLPSPPSTSPSTQTAQPERRDPMAPSKHKPFTYCEGAPSWNPTTYIADAALHERAEALLASDNLQGAVVLSFSLPPPSRDPYVYHAIVSVTLPEVQHVVSLGRQNGLHSWYFAPSSAPSPSPSLSNDDESKNANPPKKQTLTPLPPPPRPDTDAYLAIFDPTTSTPAALKTFHSNAKKGSLRAEIASYLLAKRFLHPSLATTLTIPKHTKKSPNKLPPNPYLTFLSWAARNLEWAGPSPSSALAGNRAHHVLPILMHHFGCASPSHEALEILRILAAGREVLDMGSGGGYWTFMLRQYGVRAVPVDNAQSAWRVTWVSDTVVADGVDFLRRRRKQRKPASGAKNKDGDDAAAAFPDPEEAVLLLVYPIVGGSLAGGTEGSFTRNMLDAYAGDTLAVVGTQNRNGYTGFRGESMDEYMERERERSGDGWVKVVQVALPSFPGKDEALFVFQRGPRAPAKQEDRDSGVPEDGEQSENRGTVSDSTVNKEDI